MAMLMTAGTALHADGTNMQAPSISVVTYDTATMQLQVMFQDSTLVTHEQVPQAIYDDFKVADYDSAYYQVKIVPVYPPINPDPLHETALGPIDEAYVNALGEVSLAKLQLCERAIYNAKQGGDAAYRECERVELRASRDIDDEALEMSGLAKNIIQQTRSAVAMAEMRMERKEYDKAHALVEQSAQTLQRLVGSWSLATTNMTSVTVREYHQATYYISNYSKLMEHANKTLQFLRDSVEATSPDAKTNSD